MQYAWRAMDADGHLHRGRLQAASGDELESQLARRGLDLISYRPARGELRLRRRAKRRDLIHFCFQLQQLVGAGVPLSQALHEIHAGMDHAALKDVILALIEGVEHGETLSAAMARHPQVFDQVLVALLGVGERSGRLPEALEDITAMLRWQHTLATRAVQVLAYPALVALVMTGVLAFLMGHVVPQLVSFIASLDGELPLATRALIATSAWLTAYGPWMLMLVATATAMAAFAARRDVHWRRRIDGWSLRLWWVGAVRHQVVLARMARVIGLMYRAGVPVLDGLAVAGTATGNEAVSHALAQAREAVLQGAPLGRAMQCSVLFPPLVRRMVAMGEATGALDTALLNLSDWYEHEARARMERLERALEPAVTLVLGVLLGWMVLAVLGPIYDLVGSVT
ncbi:MAG: type II secretion system F family protein [Thiohalomonadaceae bacterium]